MQSLAFVLQLLQVGSAQFAFKRALKQGFIGAIQLVSHNGVALGREMDTDLVLAARADVDGEGAAVAALSAKI